MPSLAEHLSRLCDEPGCKSTATHEQRGRAVCNKHIDRDTPAFARND